MTRRMVQTTSPPRSGKSVERLAAEASGPDPSRRALLFGVAAGGIAAGGARAVGASSPVEEEPDDPRSVRYQETEHIRQAYRRMRF